MTPIETRYDTRLVTLIGVAINTIEALALEVGCDPDKILAESLYLSNKYVHERGEEVYLNTLSTNYPMLNEALD